MTQMSNNPDAELLMPVTTADAMRQAELHVMRGIADSLSALTSRFDRMDAKQDEMSRQLTTIVAQDVRSEVKDLKRDLEKYKDEQTKLASANDNRIKTLELIVARYSGIFIPVSMVAAAMTSAASVLIISKVFGN